MGHSNPALKIAALTARLLPVQLKQALYRSPTLAGLLRATLNRAAPQGMTEIQIAAGGLSGMTLALNLQTEKDYWLGTYEADLQQAVQEWIKPGMIAYDVGANIGYITLLLSLSVGETGRVFAFEALPTNIERLRYNLSLNELVDRVTVIPAAVTAQTGLVRFLSGPSDATGKAQGSAGRAGSGSSHVFEVDGLSLDDFVFRQKNLPPDVVKMDIEGGEVLALPGMKKVLNEIAPLLFLELHGPESAQAAWQLLTLYGYEMCRMQPGYPSVKSIQELDWKAYLVGLPSQSA
jgi:FkbM family methyltransferase